METIKREKPDLLILDLQLPGLEGTDVILKLKANLEMMRKPVVVLTGLRLNDKQQKILSNFGIPTLQKPWNEDELREHVETAFLGTVTAIRRPGDKSVGVARKNREF
jgi:DNA-binding response OmpR family regulator